MGWGRRWVEAPAEPMGWDDGEFARALAEMKAEAAAGMDGWGVDALNDGWRDPCCCRPLLALL